MSVMSVRRNGLATRCEVCHQSDKFNPQTNHCSRCRGAAPSLVNDLISANQESIAGMKMFGLCCLCITGVVLLATLVNFITNYLFGQNLIEFTVNLFIITVLAGLVVLVVRALAQLTNNIFGSKSRLPYKPFVAVIGVWLIVGHLFISWELSETAKKFKDVAVNSSSKIEWNGEEDEDGNPFNRLNYHGKLDQVIRHRNNLVHYYRFQELRVRWWVYDGGEAIILHLYIFTLFN